MSYISTGNMINGYWCSLEPKLMALHHYGVGLVFILSGILVYCSSASGGKYKNSSTIRSHRLAGAFDSWQAQLSINLGVSSTLTLLFSHLIYSLTPYAYLSF